MENIIRKQFYLYMVLLLVGLSMLCCSCSKQTTSTPVVPQAGDSPAEARHASQSAVKATNCRSFAVIKDDAVKFDVSSKQIIYIAPVGYTAKSVDNVIYCSNDGGETASLIYETDRDASSAPLDFQVHSIHFFDSKNGIALGAGAHPVHLYSTDDGGATWQNELLCKENKNIVLPAKKFKDEAELESAIPWEAAALAAIDSGKIRITVPYMEKNKKCYYTSVYTKDGLQDEPRQSTAAENGAAITAKEGYAAAVSAYEAFLQGHAEAQDPKHYLSDSGTVNIHALSLGENTLHALFDMNGDGIPELHLRPTKGGGYEIFTYQGGRIVLWHADVDYCSPLNTRALLYKRPGGAPPHTNYMYITLDADGNEIARVEFSKYDEADKTDLKAGVRYIYEDKDVSKETWNALTKKYLSIKSDLIVWRTY